MWGSYFWHDSIHNGHKYVNEKIDSRITKILTSLSVFGSILKILGGTDVGRCEGHTFGWGRHDSIHNGHKYVNEKIDSYITEILTSLSAFGSILKKFWEPTSVDVRVVLLVGYDKTMYTRFNKKIDSHITEIRRAFRRSVPFSKDFWEPMSVNVRVVLLVGYDKTMYTRINEKIDSHIIEIRRAFRRSVPFWKFLGTDVG